MNKAKISGVILLLLAAIVWGFAFAAQRFGMDSLTPAQFNAVRFLMAVIVMCAVFPVTDKFSSDDASNKTFRNKKLWFCGILCGVILGSASLLQQWGLLYATAGKGGFLTALYIVMVPVLGMFMKRKTSPVLWLAVLAALGGSWLLCSPENLTDWKIGDILLILCAVVFALHILCIDKFAGQLESVRISLIQFLVASVIAFAVSIALKEVWSTDAIVAALVPLLYCAVCSSGIGYTFQIVGQKYVHPVVASLLMSLESVFAALGGWLILKENMSLQELIGCAVIFAAVLLAQMPDFSKRQK